MPNPDQKPKTEIIVRQRETGETVKCPHDPTPAKKRESGDPWPEKCEGIVSVTGPAYPKTSLSTVQLDCNTCEFSVHTDGLIVTAKKLIEPSVEKPKPPTTKQILSRVLPIRPFFTKGLK